MRTKAQVTIYIIMGFIIFVAIATLFFIKTDSTEKDLQTEIPGKVQYAGQQELRNFMDACIKDAAFNGLEIIRLQAGYIDIPSDTPTVSVANGKRIISENGIKKVINDLSGENDAAYWLDSDNRLFIPTTEYVENQLEDYVKKSILNCVNDFDSFKQRGFIVNTGELNANAEFSDEVLIKIDYQIDFEKDDISFQEKEFILRIPVGLKKSLDIATDIVVNEYVGNFLEYDLKNFIALYSYAGESDIDPDAKGAGSIENLKARYNFINSPRNVNGTLPPLTFTDGNLNCKMATWQIDDVRKNLKDNFAANFKYITIEGYGDRIPEIKNEVDRGVYQSLTHDVVNENYNLTDVEFLFDKAADFFADVQPRTGNILKPSRHTATGMKFLPIFCIMSYRFKYTLKFPVFAKITGNDSYALNVLSKTLDKENNFQFSVPIGVFLCGNQNRRCTGKSAYAEAEIQIDEKVLEEQGIKLPVETMFCDDDMRLSQIMRIRTIDAYNFAPVKDAAVFYKCGSFENECLMGISDSSGYLETKFPLCQNGELYAIKEGYSQSIKALTTETGDSLRQMDYLIEPLKELDVQIKLVDLPNFMGNYYLSNGFTTNRCTGENVAVNDATIAAANPINKNIMVTSNYGSSDVGMVYPDNNKIKLASGSYGFSYLVEGEAVVTPIDAGGQKISLNKDGSAYTGSYIFGSYNGMNFGLTIDQLKAANKIMLYVPVETTSAIVDIMSIGNIAQLDGSLYKKGMIDDDCNPDTPDKEVEINVSREDVQRLLAPRLV